MSFRTSVYTLPATRFSLYKLQATKLRQNKLATTDWYSHKSNLQLLIDRLEGHRTVGLEIYAKLCKFAIV